MYRGFVKSLMGSDILSYQLLEWLFLDFCGHKWRKIFFLKDLETSTLYMIFLRLTIKMIKQLNLKYAHRININIR